MHSDIERFHLEGEIGDDSKFVSLREQFEKMLLEDMRSDGYVPVLGMGPYFSTQINESLTYTFVLSVYGVQVGTERSRTIEGVDVYDGSEVRRVDDG